MVEKPLRAGTNVDKVSDDPSIEPGLCYLLHLLRVESMNLRPIIMAPMQSSLNLLQPNTRKGVKCITRTEKQQI